MSLTELGITNFFLFPEALSTTAAYFVHVVETPSVAFENFFLVPEGLSRLAVGKNCFRCAVKDAMSYGISS